jgi:phage gp46-like protein
VSDVKLFQTNDGGDITVVNGVTGLSSGLDTAAYLSLFGGNEDDDGRPDSPYTYWGNIDEINPSRIYRSRTQYLLKSLPSTSNNLRRVEDAALIDLNWFTTDKVASSINVVASMPGLNKIKLIINIEANGIESSFEFVENWKAAQ